LLGDVFEVFGAVGAEVGAFGEVLAHSSAMASRSSNDQCRLLITGGSARVVIVT
jgi:hypothetical protein